MSKNFGVFVFAVFAEFFCPVAASAAPPLQRQRVLIDAGWRFHRGDFPGQAGAAITNWRWTADAPASQAAAEAAFPSGQVESAWTEALPGADVFHGRRGFAWFRTTLPDSPRPGRTLHFDSVDNNATVFLNGKRLLRHEG